MATFLEAKGPSETVERRWAPEAEYSLEAVSTSASGVTVSSATIEGDEVLFVLAGGTAATTGTITATLTTQGGETLVETLYVPVIASPSQIAATARDFVDFALRKIVGIGESANDAELEDALERLSGLVARMREGGADIGAPFPLDANSVIYCPDWAVSALRYNLLIECADIYGEQPSAMEYEQARRGMQLVKHKNLPAERASEFY